jgi:glycosyltransferase involved in cell wall biosynthesis
LGWGDEAVGGTQAASTPVPLVSVIVCTRGRPDLLRVCLARLAALNDPNYEIVVVDNSKGGSLPPEGVPEGARVVREHRAGLCFARNRGIAEAHGELIAFTDDDCEIDPNWLGALRDAFGAEGTTVVTGRVLAARTDRPAERWFEYLCTFDRGDVAREHTSNGGPVRFFHPAADLGSGCNMAFRRSVIDRVGGFDTTLDVGMIRGGGDLDFFARVLDGGETVVYVPSALVRHHHRVTRSALFRQMFGYGVGVGALCLKSLLDRRRRLREVLGFERGWVRGTAHRVKAHGRPRAFGWVLAATLAAGQVVSPFPYVFHRLRDSGAAS